MPKEKTRLTIYLDKDVAKRLKYFSVDFECPVSQLVEHAITSYLRPMKERGKDDLYKQWIKQEKEGDSQ